MEQVLLRVQRFDFFKPRFMLHSYSSPLLFQLIQFIMLYQLNIYKIYSYNSYQRMIETVQSQQIVADDSPLPTNFANNLLELEMKLDSEQFDFECVKKLNQLYITAIDHYIGNDDVKKANYFQKRLMGLLNNSKTLAIIEPKVKTKAETPRIQHSVTVKEQLFKFNSQAEHYIKSLIQTSQKKLQRSQILIKEDLNKQQNELKNRMLQRVRSRRTL